MRRTLWSLAKKGTKKKRKFQQPLVYHPDGKTRTDEDARAEFEERDSESILHYPHVTLLQGCHEVSESHFQQFSFSQRHLHMYKLAMKHKVYSICAPKVRWSDQVILIRTNENAEFETWVNPEVPGYDDKNSVAPMHGFWENDLSMGYMCAWVIRPQEITVYGKDEYGNEKSEKMDGFKARLLMHELDYLRGTNMLRQALGPDFIVSFSSLLQKELWQPSFPSMEAYNTPPLHFFNYSTNCVEPIMGMEMFTQGFDDLRTMFDDRQLKR